MRIIITGATGFVGRHLLRALAPRHELICLARDPRRVDQVAGVAAVKGDLGRPGELGRLPERADAVIHLAQANARFPDAADELFAVNAVSTQRLAAYALRAGVSHFVYASSGSVYPRSAAPLREDAHVRPADFYALTKLCSEGILNFYGAHFKVCVLRLFAPYGPGQQGRMVPNIVRSVSEGRPVKVVNGGQPRINPIYVDDAVGIIAQSLTLPTSEVVNVAGPQVVGVAEIASIAGGVVGRPPVFEYVEEGASWNLIADTSRMREVFAANDLVGVGEGVRRMLEAPAGV